MVVFNFIPHQRFVVVREAAGENRKDNDLFFNITKDEAAPARSERFSSGKGNFNQNFFSVIG
jgi:hypothetical protein